MAPKLSIVVTSRNDSNNPNDIRRMQVFIDGIMDQTRRFAINSELILIEWNPPQNRPGLADVLEWPVHEFCPIRIIKVPYEIHSQFKNSVNIPLFQMIAKNVGIRRARGTFVLATNIDILFSDQLMKFLSSKRLKKKRMYRIDRYDVPKSVPFEISVSERLDWCYRNTFQVYQADGVVEVKNGRIPISETSVEAVDNTFFSIRKLIHKPTTQLHTNACGDFTLLSTKYWHLARGYPELPLRAMKLDGLFCYIAHFTGAKELVLKDPLRIYHMDHPARSDGALVAINERKTEQDPQLQLSFAQFKHWREEMRKNNRPVMFNDSEWGLAGISLEESVIN